jgi:hypothetical protein
VQRARVLAVITYRPEFKLIYEAPRPRPATCTPTAKACRRTTPRQ